MKNRALNRIVFREIFKKNIINLTVLLSIIFLIVSVSYTTSADDTITDTNQDTIEPANTHTADVTSQPDITSCNAEKTFTITVTHTSGDPIREVRLLNGSYNGNTYPNLPPHKDFTCGDAPEGWVLIDQHPYGFPYCQYQAKNSAYFINTVNPTKDFTFSAITTTESNYKWAVETYDIHLAWQSHTPPITVDCTDPETEKYFDGPQKIDGHVEWIDGITKVVLEATDPDPHPSGIDKTLYLNVLAEDYDLGEEPCWNPQACQPIFLSPPTECVDAAEEKCNYDPQDQESVECVEDYIYYECMGQPNFKWQVYTEPFTKEDESCHILEYYSIDDVSNTEDVKVNCFFVDKTIPIIKKEVGSPRVEGDHNPTDWWVTQNTSIELNCEDVGPHPSNDVTIYWKYTVDGGQPVEGSHNGESYTLYFPEDTTHVLEFWCKDAVEKESEHDIETFIVDSQHPIITKEMFGSWLGDCPPEEGDVCYVADDNSSGVEIKVNDPEPHPVDNAKCYYELWWENQTIQSGSFSNYQEIVFNEDSTHTLKIWCEDALGNEMYDEEVFLVDSTPPETTKEYGQPWFPGEYPKNCEQNNNVDLASIALACLNSLNCPPPCSWTDWITTKTPVYLSTTDIKVGVDKTYWRNLLVEEYYDEICGHPEEQYYYCNPEYYMQHVVNPNEEFQEYIEPFNKEEESCHVIEYYSIDKLGNEEKVKWQCVFVDDTAPNVTKEIGEPKVTKQCEELTDNDIEIQTPDPSTRIGDTFVESSAIIANGVCSTATQPEQCAELDSDSLPPFVEDTIEIQGGNLENPGCDKILILSSGDPNDNDNFISTNMGNPGCGFNPDGFDTYDCVDLPSFTPTADSVVLSISSEWPEYYLSEFTDWMRIGGIVDMSINSWLGQPSLEDMPEYDPDDSGSVTLATVASSTSVDLRVADSGDEIYDTALIVVPLSCFEEPPQPELCGNHVVDPGEECDDGNIVNGDGCSSVCLLEEEEECTQTYITQNTPVTLTCQDIEPHPVDHVSLWYRYRVSKDCNDWNEWTEWIDPNGLIGAEKTIYFTKDSCHELEYYCEDALGNKGETFKEIDIVDTVPPVTTKEIMGPQYYDEKLEKLYIDGQTKIKLTCTDPEPHPVNDVTIYYRYMVDDSEWTDWIIYEEPFSFQEESRHTIEYYCVDALKNEEEHHTEIDYVDHSPPLTSKWYEGPEYPEQGYPKWINLNTLVYLEATDGQEIHDSGVKETYWRNTLVDDAYCLDQDLCQQAQSSGDWNTYEEPFQKQEESCHLIEYYSVDNVDKQETIKKQCVYVDNSPPTPIKEVYDPKTKWDGQDSDFYPWIKDYCWNGQENQIDCWKVTLDTPINMSCIDPEPHPSDNERICFNVELDADNATELYCKEYDGELVDNYCCLEKTIDDFTFLESSEHNLKFYCEDAVGNKGPIDEEKFKVEGEDFIIDINKKWNLISVPVVLLNPDIEEVIPDSMGDKIISVWTYDAETNQWYVYTPDGDDGNDNLDELIPGWGYWVLAKAPTQIVIGGSLLAPGHTPPSRNLLPGWNIIGYYGTEDFDQYTGPNGDGRDAYCALYSLTSGETGIPKWSSLYGYWNPWEPDFQDYIFWESLDPGAGYWINMKDNQQEYIYSPSTICWNAGDIIWWL